MNNPEFTEAQIEARNKAWALLAEHFDKVVLALDTESPDGDDDSFEVSWIGGLSTAIGLAERAKLGLISHLSGPEEGEEWKTA